MKIVLNYIENTDKYNSQNGRLYFIREVEIPFTPFVGLEFSLDEGNFEATIENISWDGEVLNCWCGEDNNGSLNSKEEIIKNFIDAGWKLDES